MRRSLHPLAIAIALTMTGCGGGDSGGVITVDSDPSEPSTTEISFRSGDFELAGELLLPAGNGPHPALAVVHSSGPQTRHSTPTSGLIKWKFLDAGFAVLSWDKPGSEDRPVISTRNSAPRKRQ